MDIKINDFVFKHINEHHYEVIQNDQVLGEIGYVLISAMNEFKLIELKCDILNYDVIYSFVDYLIKEEYVLKIIINPSEDLKEIITKVGFVSVNETQYKITKPMFLGKKES